MYTQSAQSVAEPIVVNLMPPEIKVAAGGEPVDIIAEVKNAGTTVDQYTIEIENLDPTWYTIVVPSVSLFPGDSAPIPIRIHPPRGKDTRPGHHAFVVRARSHSDPNLIGKTKGVVVIGSFSVFHMELEPKRVTAFRGKYRVRLQNGGNGDLQLGLSAEDPDAVLAYNFSKADPIIAPNSKEVVPFVVRPRGLRLVGEEEKYKFTVTAHPVEGTDEDNKIVQGELIHKPPFAAWKWPLVILAALLLLFAFVIIRPNLNPCSPTVFLFQGIPPQARFYYSLLCKNQASQPAANTPVAAQGIVPTKVPGDQNRFPETFASGAGFVEVRNQHGDDIGPALENEWYEPNGVSHQRTSLGQLMYFLKCDKPDPKDGNKCAETPAPHIYFINKDGQAFTFSPCNPPRDFRDCAMTELKGP